MEADGGLPNHWFHRLLSDFLLFGPDRGTSLSRKNWFPGGYRYNFKHHIQLYFGIFEKHFALELLKVLVILTYRKWLSYKKKGFDRFENPLAL